MSEIDSLKAGEKKDIKRQWQVFETMKNSYTYFVVSLFHAVSRSNNLILYRLLYCIQHIGSPILVDYIRGLQRCFVKSDSNNLKSPDCYYFFESTLLLNCCY